MYPRLLDWGVVELPVIGQVELFLPSYGVLYALGALLAWWWFTRRARTLGIADEDTFNLCFYTLLAGIFGAKLLLVLLDLPFYLRNPAELLGSLRSAGVLIGGVVAGAAVFAWYARRHGLPVLRLGDAIAAPLALAQSVGRLGCYAAGCCYGVETHAANPIAIVFTNPVANAQTGVPLNRPLVPTQPIQMVNDLLLALVLTWLWRRRPEPPGAVLWWYVLLYAVTRGVIEFWRGDANRGLFLDGALSTSQIFSLFGIVLALAMLVRGRAARGQATGA